MKPCDTPYEGTRMNETLLWGSFVVLFGGMITMLISSAIAKHWLTANAGYQQSRAAVFFLGPILTSFGPVKTYAELRRARGMPTTVATVFWIGTAVWALGIVALLGSLAAL
jgi:hypothetical protein